jgi:hypothetical protein
MRFVAVLLLGLSLVGCGQVVSDRAVTGRPLPAHHGAVRLFLESDQQPTGYTEIAIVRAIGTGSEANLESVFEGLRKEAQAVGANAVIRVRVDHGAGVAGIGVAVRLPDGA